MPTRRRKNERTPPELRALRYYTAAELAIAADAALVRVGVMQSEAAEELGVSRELVTRAVNPDNSRGLDVCRALLEKYNGYTFGPDEASYQLRRVG